MTETLTIIGLLARPVWFSWLFVKGAKKGSSTKKTRESSTPRADTTAVRKPYILTAGPVPELSDMPHATTRLLTYQEERHAATARQLDSDSGYSMETVPGTRPSDRSRSTMAVSSSKCNG